MPDRDKRDPKTAKAERRFLLFMPPRFSLIFKSLRKRRARKRATRLSSKLPRRRGL